MEKIARCINSNKNIIGMKLEWIDLLNDALSAETKAYISKGNLDLDILAELIKQTMESTKGDDSLIDEVLWDKLHDQNLVIGLMANHISPSSCEAKLVSVGKRQ